MLLHPATVLGVGDGGAHVSMICDASTPTYMLTHWARDRSRGPKLPIETVVHKMTKNNADLYGLTDRGVVAPGAPGRPQRDRPRPAHAARARVPPRPAERRTPPGAGGAGLRGHVGGGHRDPSQRHRHRRPPRRARPLRRHHQRKGDPMTLLDDPSRTESLEGLAITASGLDRRRAHARPRRPLHLAAVGGDRGREGVAPRLADRLLARPRGRARRLLRVPGRLDLDPRRAGRRRRAAGVPERLPPPGQRHLPGHRLGALGAALPVPPVGVDHRGPPQPGAQPQGLRRHRQRRVRADPRPGRHLWADWCS